MKLDCVTLDTISTTARRYGYAFALGLMLPAVGFQIWHWQFWLISQVTIFLVGLRGPAR
jgi:hypothetical protein